MTILLIMRKNLLWTLLALAFISCGGRPDNNEFVVQGTLDNASDHMLILEELTTADLIPLDSILTDGEGNLSFKRSIEEAGFYILRVDEKNFVTLLIEPGEVLRISGDALRLGPTFEVSGSEGSKLLASLNKRQWEDFQIVDSLTRVYRDNKYEPGFPELREVLHQEYKRVFKGQQEFVMRFIDENPESLASILALYQHFGNKLLLKEDEHFGYFESLSQSLADVYPLNKHVLDLKRRVSEHKRKEAQRLLAEESLAPGSPAPDIVLPDPDGNQIALSALKGKVVLIDFWAAWCPPCRKSNQELKRIYDKYRDRGFEIYAVSLDRTLDQWVLGIEEDDIPWIQVSDLRFWNSPVVGLYNVEAIPYAVLIDREMNIVAKGLTPEQLEAKLTMMFAASPTL